MGHAFLFIFLTLDNLSSNIGNMDNQSTGKSHKALIITIATLLLAGAGTANYLQYQHGKKQERHFTYQISALNTTIDGLQSSIQGQQEQIIALNATVDGLQTEVKHLNSEVERLHPLAEFGIKVQEERRLQAQREEEEEYRLNSAKAKAQQELSTRGFPPSSYERELGYAIKNNNTELLGLLLTAGTNPNAANALYLAVVEDRTECVKLLLAAPGIDVNKRFTSLGNTPLHIAAEKGHAECVRLLLAAPGIDVNKTRELDSTPLYLAAREGHTECVKLLLAAPGIDVNRADFAGNTPLYWAARYGHTECVKLLEAAGGRR